MSRRSTTSMRKGAPVFAALGDETRLRIVVKLAASGAQSIAQITEGEAITRQAITKHLSVLAEVGLVRDRRRGRERLWELEPAPLTDALRYLGKVSARWDRARSRHKRF